MAEPEKQQIGDGSDNYGQAAGQMAKAVKQAGQAAAKQAAAKGAEATANAAATVKASVEGGKAAAEIAAGTAAGGPWGAILSAAWAMRHTLFKILLCICLSLLFLIVMIVSLPSIVSNSIFGLDGTQPTEGATLMNSYTEMADAVSGVVDDGYNQSLSRVEELIESGGYDYELSMDALVNYAQGSAGYDVSYILAAYSASMQQQNTSKSDMLSKLRGYAGSMFPVTSEERQTERQVTVTITNEDGTESTTTETEIVKYLVCTIHPFDNTVITQAFGIDLDATYDQFNISYDEAIRNMANALKWTLYGAISSGQAVPLTDAELIAFVNRQNCSAMRKHILSTALSLVGKVPYFWGGKSPPGWNDEWNTPKLVTSAGSSSTGTIRPYGLDCSGFTNWTYKTAVGVSLYEGTWGQWANSYGISASELLPGDLGFLGSENNWTHVLIFAGYGESGERMWVHSSGGQGVILNTPSYEATLSLRRPSGVDFDAPVAGNVTGTPTSTLEVEVTHYCACAKCCGSNADGITASGKQVSRGMVAMSSYYPFGTQIMINGTMYTVEDRGGTGIESDIHRVDIFVPDHNEALRLGRYKTTATIYRMGR